MTTVRAWALCGEPSGCAELVPPGKSRCAEHERLPWRNSDRGSRLPPDWRARRVRVMRRDNGICHVCGDPGSDAVDHIVQGDDHSLTNLAPIHENVPPYCHRTKSAREGAAARARRR